MKYAVFSLILTATGAQADSLCGVTDIDVVCAAMAGEWSMRGAMSVESVVFSVTDVTAGRVLITPDGVFSSVTVVDGAEIPDVVTDENSKSLLLGGPVYDVDVVDDMLETVEADWIADAVSLTPCGPDDLLQLSTVIDVQDVAQGTLTIIPYFTDQIVMISEVEVTGDWGIGFVTEVGLLTPE